MSRTRETQNVTVRLPTDLIKEIDEQVDKIKYRNRTHFIETALKTFLGSK